jgi:hypothetical protein
MIKASRKIFNFLFIFLLFGCTRSPYMFEEIDPSQIQSLEIGETFRIPVPLSNDYEIIQPLNLEELGNQDLIIRVNGTNGSYQILALPYELVDTTRPTINLNGQTVITIEAGESWIDPGFNVTDNHRILESGVTTSGLSTINDLSNAQLGQYQFDYYAIDEAGNTNTVTRTIFVRDTKAPAIAPVEKIYVLLNEVPFKPVVSVIDNYDSRNSIQVSFGPSFSQPIRRVGRLTETISAVDSSENQSTTSVEIEAIHNEESLFELLVSHWRINPKNPELLNVLREYNEYDLFPRTTLRIYQDIFTSQLTGNLNENLGVLLERAPGSLISWYASNVLVSDLDESQRILLESTYSSGLIMYLEEMTAPNSYLEFETQLQLYIEASGVVESQAIESGVKQLSSLYLESLGTLNFASLVNRIDEALPLVILLEEEYQTEVVDEYYAYLDSGILNYRLQNPITNLEFSDRPFSNIEFRTNLSILNDSLVISGLILSSDETAIYNQIVFGSGGVEIQFEDQIAQINLAEDTTLLDHWRAMISANDYSLIYGRQTSAGTSKIPSTIEESLQEDFRAFVNRVHIESIAAKWDR